ncbi:hypothetical protein F2P45_11350 [Massilia sp. CCM 8733]|uniref:Uncharacterized protein n=1 Tax=Massilia mucilaginosa TaxID=2609282 RepID=A0ABX0NS41_9BURK|nr:hypothetical protein [Massilia mucilaginosa]NHZ89606.1 hypothetical protein [Massilia mucilaginosa]
MNTPKLSLAQLRRAMQCAAMCAAAVTSKDGLRAFWYHENWSDSISMGKYDNGAGDNVVAFFTSDGKALIKGFDHESEVSPHARDEYEIWPGIYDGIPSEFLSLLQDEAAEYEHATFCCWCEDGQTWKTGNAHIPDEIDDGAEWLLGVVQMDADEFIEWGKSYYEATFDLIGEDGVFAAFGQHAPVAAGSALDRKSGDGGA